jgi:phage shock protein PspC (stress-responsive transcriptional regulator)
MTQKKLTRSMDDRKIAGVCGGIGEYLNVDPLVFRILFLFLLFCGGSGLLLYIIMWILMPEKKNAEPIDAEYEEVEQHTVIDGVEDAVNNINHSLNNNFMKKNRGIFWGLLLVILGLLWLGKTFDIFYFNWCNVLKLWPMLIICLGISLLPIEQIWKNVCNFVILVIAIVLLFVLPAKNCHFHWNDKCIKSKIYNSEYSINDEESWDCDEEIDADTEIINVKVDSGVVTINQETVVDGEKKVTVKKIKL